MVLVILIIASTGTVVAVEPAVRRPNLHFFFLGAGFMLLETRSITQMALLFGSTWNVNAIVFVSILLAILIANAMVQWNLSPSPRLSYAVLLPVLAIGSLLPIGSLLSLSFLPRLLAAGAVVGLPILWASFLFSLSFRDETNVDRAFGSNLLGVVFGGSLEYLSNVWGLNALYLVALVIYTASALTLPRGREARDRITGLANAADEIGAGAAARTADVR